MSSTVNVNLTSSDRSYPIYFRPLDNVPTLLETTGLRPGRCLVVTDDQVAHLHAAPLVSALEGAGWNPHLITVPAGESTKSLSQLQAIYDQVLGWSIDRNTPLLALGGGVVGDLAGFAAASVLRGIPLIQLPTTLIAQADSAIGGKTGINHTTGKNLIGAFYQPAFVCMDTSVLQTLPDREWTSGLAEVVKYAFIEDADFFQYLMQNDTAVLKRDQEAVDYIVRRSAEVKAEIVSEDERESGRRAVLNFGHTFAHAIEKTAGYGRFTHGEAVALGMMAALHLSHQLHPKIPLERGIDLIRRIPVQESLDAYPVETLMQAMQSDKKRKRGRLHFVLLDRIGHAYVTDHPTPDQVEAAWKYVRGGSF